MGDMQKLLPERTIGSIRAKAGSLGLPSKYPKFPNVNYTQRHKWTKLEEEYLENAYSNMEKISDIAEHLQMTETQITDKAQRMGLTKKYIKCNNPNFKAIYQDYDWCYERYVIRGMTHEEMALEAGCTKRVIEKWCSQIHQINRKTFKSLKTINDIQRQVIMFGTLGDGHIDNRRNQPMYIESHCESEKDYLFWKYDILKDLCHKAPTYYPASYNNFGSDKMYLCEPFYRLNTKIIDDLLPIREMPRIEKIKQLNEFGFALHMLDDGCRRNMWQICLAEWTQEEMDTYQAICYEKFGIYCNQAKDKRYYNFDAVSSKIIDDIILSQIPNELDIIHKKIIDNDNIKDLCNYRYVVRENGKIGLSSYCRSLHKIHKYEKLRDYVIEMGLDEIPEDVALQVIQDAS